MPDPFQPYVISVMSRDRIGIIAEVASAISSLHGDIADLRQSVLRDYFTMILLARFPPQVRADSIREAIMVTSQGSAYSRGADPPHVEVIPADMMDEPSDVAEPAQNGRNYLLTARGRDRVGFVAAVTGFCAANNLNILDLATTVFKGDYVMMLLVDVSKCGDLDALRGRLAAFGAEAGLYAVLQHEAIFRATNEVDR